MLKENQFGFRQDRSTIDALLELSKNIRLNWQNSNQNTISTFLELKKAFDTVDHRILLAKFYLSRRPQYNEIGPKKSSMRSIEFGVPQGSIMGPLLFILYINDLTLETSDIKPILYADATVVIQKMNPKQMKLKSM